MRNWVGAALVALSMGCSAEYPGSPTPTPQLAGIQLHYSRPHTFIAPGTSITFVLYAIDSEGVMENVTARASWVADNSTVITINTPGSGSARAIVNGAADVIASYQGHTATARVVVAATQFFPYVELTPPTSHQVGLDSRATAIFVQGTTRLSVTDQATWTSSNPDVMSVERGVITSHGPGTAAITADYNGLSSTYYASVAPLRALP